MIKNRDVSLSGDNSMLNPWKEIKRLNRIIDEQSKIIANLTARLELLENRKKTVAIVLFPPVTIIQGL